VRRRLELAPGEIELGAPSLAAERDRAAQRQPLDLDSRMGEVHQIGQRQRAGAKPALVLDESVGDEPR
jgi:hypothetical protein